MRHTGTSWWLGNYVTDGVITSRLKIRGAAILWGIATAAFFVITIALMAQMGKPGPQGPPGTTGAQGPPGPPDEHLATAYWYRTELDRLRNDLVIKWSALTNEMLKYYLENRSDAIPRSSIKNDISGVEGTIKNMVKSDFNVELDLYRHPRFDENRFYPVPKVDQITNDYDKEEYRRLYDQFSQTKYTLDQVIAAYEYQITKQEGYIINYIERSIGCTYMLNGNFICP